MLDKLFTSTTRVKILRMLMFNPGRQYYLRELARKIKTTPTYVKKEIENLQELGLVQKRKKGNLTLFRINEDSLIFNELKELFIKSDYVLFRQMYEKTAAPDTDTLAEFNSILNEKNKLKKRGILDEKE
jgi:predicted transcriptional regulator with HTH domain